MDCRYIIEGFTEDGRKFRPSDWIDRISSMKASYGPSHRLVFHDYLHPELYNGQKCLIIDERLKDEDPEMFQYVMDFVTNNKLKMSHVCDIDQDKLGS